MERSKLIFWIVISAASVFIVYWVGFRPPVEDSPTKVVDPNAVREPNAPGDANAPAEPNGPGRSPRRFGDRGRFDGPRRPGDPNAPVDPNAPGEPNAPSDPNRITASAGPAEPNEAINLKEVEMKNVLEKIARWTGKTVIPDDEAMKQKITIYAPGTMPRSRALAKIYSALRMKGFVAETTDDTIFLRPIGDIKLGSVPTVPANQPLAAIENKDQVVQKFFQLENYSAQQMSSVIQPLIGEHGYVTADENARSLLIIDTVSNLMRLERIIAQFDIPESAPMVTKVFDIKFGDPSEIVQMLNILLGEEGTISGSSSRRNNSNNRNRNDRFGMRSFGPNPEPSSSSRKPSTGSAESVVVGTTRGPIVLIPEPRRNWIIARGSADDIERIAEWITKLDKEEPVGSDYEIVNLRYADPGEVEDSVGDGFRDLPGTEFLPSVLIEPLEQTRQVIIFGRRDLREIVKKMIAEIDVPPGMYETRHFPLKYADPDQIKTMIEELFSQSSSSQSASRYTYVYNYGGSRGGSSSQSANTVKVISYTTLKQVTVIASPEKMEEIAAQIKDWDKPLDVEAVKPRIIELKNSDPIEMAELLKTLFSEETTSRMSIFDILYGSSGQTQAKIVGPLYGQLTFEDVPGTKKIIVISKIPEAYDVIEQLVLDLDREEMAEIPEVIEVKYADVEDLSERLNAMFVEAGQQARIRQTQTGLSDSSSMEESSSGSSSTNNSNSSNNMTTLPWGSSGARGRLDETMPISNVIGRIRFVPEPHTKSIMVLAPPEFMDEIRDLIGQLDVPGKQVLVQAIIVEIEHSKVTSLGVELATNPAAFGSLSENAITALANITHVGSHGSVSTSGGTISAATGVGTAGTGTLLGVGTDVYALIDFLIKTTDARILNQQSLWTKDNEEASFFKGQEVAFLGSTSITTSTTTQSVDFERVGMELRTRPSITPEDKVDMVVNVQISQLTSDLVNSQPVRTLMNTTTNMIIEDGQSLLLGGILFQKDSLIQRKLPGLGDLPGIGGLFRHEAVNKTNSEMLVFITPRVVDEKMENVSEATRAAIKAPKEKLDKILGDLTTALEGLDQ
ncbi:MAG: hypothetical protein JW720_01480 [Sedimentisphaerales bacterium]|nr:hypothetical protein [Sedimentisphaerales bacterium]